MLVMKKRGIRFFSKIKFNNTQIKRYYGKKGFIPYVASRREKNDNILLMAHGWKDSILTTTTDPSRPYDIYISSEETSIFQNDFVFAISCLTALEFGGECVKNGAIAYLGYQVEIGRLFNCYTTSITNMPKRISNAVDIIMKRIFIQSLAKAYEEFLCHPRSVKVLRERFSYLLERSVVDLTLLTNEQIYEMYGVKILERHYQKYMVAIMLRTLSELKETTMRLVCIGESNYISPTFIRHYYLTGYSKEEMLSKLYDNESYRMLNDEYKKKLNESITEGEKLWGSPINIHI